MTRTLLRVNKFADIEPAFLTKRKIRGLIVDLDGTLIEHGGETLPPEVIEKMRDLLRDQIRICIFSNNLSGRSRAFVDLGIGVVSNIPRKPNPQGFLMAMKQNLELDKPEECAMIGDDFNTDGGANDVGMHFIHVKPIRGKEPLWVKITGGYADIWARFHDLLRRLIRNNADGNY